jgi:hypothetical protein
MLYEETVERGTLALIKKLSADEFLQNFVLVGGTALALQIGHRKSLDIDMFSPKGFDSKSLSAHLSERYSFEPVGVINNGVFGFIDRIKMDLISHQYIAVKPPLETENIRMASLDDIAAMKLHAIVESGARLKDFVDIYTMLEHRTLQQMTDAYEMKYPGKSAAIAKNALLYHDQIDFKADIKLIRGKPDWLAMAERLRQAVIEPKKSFVLKNAQLKRASSDDLPKEAKRTGKGRGR